MIDDHSHSFLIWPMYIMQASTAHVFDHFSRFHPLCKFKLHACFPNLSPTPLVSQFNSMHFCSDMLSTQLAMLQLDVEPWASLMEMSDPRTKRRRLWWPEDDLVAA